MGVRRVATAEKSRFLNKISPDVSRACAAPDRSMLMVGTTRALAVYICGPPPRTRPFSPGDFNRFRPLQPA